ncbi:MAG: response regulator [Bacteroidales bacterium]|nr:response regulator [Bacteroidales bacterium]
MGRFVVVGIFIFNSLLNFAQNNPLQFSRITTQEGLSNNWVRDIYQDQKGFMWFGTRDGLNRYDGYFCKAYRPEFFKDNPLGDIAVNSIQEIDGKLWVGTDIGLFMYDSYLDKLVPLTTPEQLSVTCILMDNNQQVWLGTHTGLYRYNKKDSIWTHFVNNPDNPLSITNSYITRLFLDSESNIWVGTRNGLNLFQENSNTFSSYFITNVWDINSDYDVMAIAEDKLKRIWIGSTRKGLYVLDRQAQKASKLSKVRSGAILDLLIDSYNVLWVAKGGNQGLERIHLNNFSLTDKTEIEHYTLNRANPSSLSDNSVFCLYKDHLNDIWIGTFEGGVNYYSPRAKKFQVIQESFDNSESIKSSLVNSFFEEKDYLWIGTEGGLDRYNKKTGKYSHYEYDVQDPSSIGGNPIYAIYKDHRGNLWIGTWAGGLYLFDYKTETFKRYLPGDRPGSLSNASIFSIAEDSRGNLWIGTIGGGLNRFDYTSETFIHYKHDTNNPSSLDNDYVHNILETSKGILYIATSNSLEEFNYENNNFIHYPHFVQDSSNQLGEIRSIFEDSRNNIWIATNKGLEIFNEEQKVFVPYNIETVIRNSTIQGILEDDRGNLWISTNKGISKIELGIFTPEPAISENFTVEDGIAGNESIKRAAYKNDKGIMFFGSSSGFTYFHPDSIFLNPVIPNVVITGFNTLFSTPDKNVKYTTIQQNIETLDKLELSYRDADFIIEFAALNYLNSIKNQYRYKLEGYDKNWIDAGNQRAATYTNISPGKYTFIVMGSNNDGVWNSKPKTLDIIIYPPWWKTWAFRIFIIILLLIALYSIYRIRISLLQKQKKILEKSVKERTLELSEINTLLEERTEEITMQNDELSQHRNHLEDLIKERTTELEAAKIKAERSDALKSAFLANMSHEIRTPLNAIVGFSSLFRDDELTNENKNKYVDIIESNSEALLVLINDILDISLIEANQLVLSKDTFEADKILIELESFYNMKNTKGITITFESKNNRNLKLHNDSVRFRQVFSNLLGNAYKYTDEGRIRFGYQIVGKEVRFYVSDSGIGIPKAEFPLIFEHFYKIENTERKLYRGTGIGLSISKKLVELMGGELWLESTVNKGTVFYFTLPFDQPEELIEEQQKTTSIIDADSFKNIQVLIVEDEPANYELVHNILKSRVGKMFWAKNGKEAIDFVQEQPQIKNLIILMDIKMPIINGYDANREIRKINSKIPVVALTAYAQAADKEKIKKENFDAYISKPFKPETLISVLQKLKPKL